jgi:hypothetical protein
MEFLPDNAPLSDIPCRVVRISKKENNKKEYLIRAWLPYNSDEFEYNDKTPTWITLDGVAQIFLRTTFLEKAVKKLNKLNPNYTYSLEEQSEEFEP